MKENDTISCDLRDELGFDLSPMYRILFDLSCLTVPLGIVFNVVFLFAFIFRGKRVFNVHNQALFLSCFTQVILAFVQGPIRVYFYYHNGCLPVAGSSLCLLMVYLDYIPTQINDFLVVQLSVERLLLVVRPLSFRRPRHRRFSVTISLHYLGIFVAIAFPCLYYPIIMQNGAATIDLDDPSATQTCDLWYARDIYETFDLLITFVPYFLILINCLPVTIVLLHRKFHLRNHRRLLFSLNLFLLWFLITWSPWVLYDFFQTVLNLTYSVYIDAITTFIVYLSYTFSSTIVLFTFKEFRNFCFRWKFVSRDNRVGITNRSLDKRNAVTPIT